MLNLFLNMHCRVCRPRALSVCLKWTQKMPREVLLHFLNQTMYQPLIEEETLFMRRETPALLLL